MKRLFGHTKKSFDNWEGYDENDYDWDLTGNYEQMESEGYVDEGEAVYSDEAGEYYTEDEQYDEEEYYAEDGQYAEGEYYAEDGQYAEDAYYAEDEQYVEGEFYAEEANYTEDEYYAEEYNPEDAYYEGDTYCAEEEYYEEERDVRTALLGNKSVKNYRGNFFYTLWERFLDMAVMDRMITATGVIVLILALVTGSLYVSTKTEDAAVSALANVGSQLEGIELIGEKGLLAVADAEMARQAAAEIVEQEEERTEYDETEYSNAVTVRLNMTSVKKDLKIKFTNKQTDKLISNVPFSVTVTDPDGKNETWFDDDMDGIIYKKSIAPGKYQILMNELSGDKYQNYTISTVAQSVEVKKDIEYKKIDVSDEVKTEDEIDVSKEDTKINETEIESTLKDTVAWVESTAVAQTYTEVLKSTIQDPATIKLAKAFLRTAEVTQVSVSGGDVQENQRFTATVGNNAITVASGKLVTPQVSVTGNTKGAVLKYSIVSDDASVVAATIFEDGLIHLTGGAAGTTTVTVTVDYKEGASYPVVIPITVTVPAVSLTLDKTAETAYISQPITLTATLAKDSTGIVLAESSNTNVATVTVSDKTITVTPIAEGEVVITVKCTEGTQIAQAVCTVKVKPHPKDNKTDKLKDTAGNQLYVLENEAYREAVYADYYTADKFFIKGEVKYTGWQTIDGHVYYFTAEGKKVTGEQVIQGAKYNFASDGSLTTGSGTMGIDVSKWNGKINWEAVKNSGVSYVIIRCGYRGSSQGKLIEDPKFTANIKGATAAGLKVGVYFFTQATDEIEAVEEASYVLEKIKNYKISYPVFLDVEPSGGRGDKIDKATRTAVCKAFCETIQRAGYTAGIYANKTWLNEKMDVSQLSAYKIWLAQYAAAPTYTGRYDMWQYTSKGKVSGISGDVDLNVSYLGY